MPSRQHPPTIPGGEDRLDPALGRSLAETQHLNSREFRAGEAARGAIRRAAPDRERRLRHRRRLSRAIVLLIAAVAALGGLVWLIAP